MVVPSSVVGICFLVTGLGVLVLLSKPIRHSQMPGSTGFFVAIVALSLYALSEGVNIIVATDASRLVIWHLRVFAAGTLSAGWLLLALGFTAGRPPSIRVQVVVLAYPLVLGIGLGVDVLTSAGVFLDHASTTFDESRIVSGRAIGFGVHTAISYAAILCGTGLIAIEAIRSNGLRRKQSIVLAGAAIPPFTANVLFVFGLVVVPYDLTIVGLMCSAVLLSWGLYRMELLAIAPVARQTAMGEMDDAVVTLDAEDRVVDSNAAARRLFDVDTEYFGLPAATFFSPLPMETRDRLLEETDVESELRADIEGELRHFSVSISPIRTEGRTNGRVIVLRDITPIKRREVELEAREEELELLRQVFSRVLRHNIRNELTVVRGVGEVLATEVEAPYDEQAALIVESSNDLLSISEKAREIEQLVDTDVESDDYELRTVAETVATEIRNRYPTATIEVEGAEQCPVRCSPGIEAALTSLLENAVEYSTEATPHAVVRIDDTDDRPRITVVDDGPGIDDEELTMLNEPGETQLHHGSGIGLWLVKWVADRSSAALTVETDDSGTAVTIEFRQAARVRDRPAAAD